MTAPETPQNQNNSSHSSGSADPCSSTASTTPCSGVRRKAIPTQNVDKETRNGTKKKVRPNGCFLKSPIQEYYQLWNLSNNSSGSEDPEINAIVNFHRPLERSSNKAQKNSIEGFSFDLIDTDEQDFGSDNLISGIDFIELCELDGKRSKNENRSKGLEELPPLSTSQMDDCEIVPEDTITPSKLLLRKTLKSHGEELGATAVSALEETTAEEFIEPVIKPHRPLSRTLSNRESRSYNNGDAEILNLGESSNMNVRRSPPLSGNSTRSASPLESPIPTKPLLRPQPRPLTRVGLICPPTPTHHARKLRSSSLYSTTEPVQVQEIRHADIITLRQDPGTSEIQSESSIQNQMPATEDDVDSPIRHISSTRLPSIPERALASRGILAEDESLPPAWEARMDSHGRIFYIDHTSRTTTWQRPTSSSGMNPPGCDQHRQQLDRRYQSIRRTIYSRSRSPPRNEGIPAQIQSSETHPALPMICRPDFYSMLHTNQEAIVIYNRNSALKHMISRIRRDPTCFSRYEHNRDLVALVNCFAILNQDLPSGWETKLESGSGKQFFIDHMHRKTSFMDPRLPIECLRTRGRQQQDMAPVPPPRPPALPRLHVGSPEVPVAYNDKVVAFLRQPNILEILRERHGSATSSRSLREKINAIRVEGSTALERLGHDLQLTILLR